MGFDPGSGTIQAWIAWLAITGMCNGRGTVSNGGTFKLAGQWFNRLLMERENVANKTVGQLRNYGTTEQ